MQLTAYSRPIKRQTHEQRSKFILVRRTIGTPSFELRETLSQNIAGDSRLLMKFVDEG
jgi:hypothetical protein